MSMLEIAVLCLVCTALPTAARPADVFRCGNSIVDIGLTAAEVVAKCGQPDTREVVTEPVRARAANGTSRIVGTTSIEHWLYERGTGRFPAYLTFDQGFRLTAIELLIDR